MEIGLLLIATRRYKQFVQPLLEGVKKYFFVNHNVTVHLFIDELEHEFIGNDRVKIVKELIPAYTFPNATLLRYHCFVQKTYSCDYLFYSDVDMSFVDFVDETILGNIIAVRHPGFDRATGGSWCTDENSTAYTFPEFRKTYYAGGFSGGETKHYYRAMQEMKRNIDEDNRLGIKAEHNDESHFNKFLSEYKEFKELDSSYCMVEQISLRQAWGISDLQPKILALAKDHDKIRN